MGTYGLTLAGRDVTRDTSCTNSHYVSEYWREKEKSREDEEARTSGVVSDATGREGQPIRRHVHVLDNTANVSYGHTQTGEAQDRACQAHEHV